MTTPRPRLHILLAAVLALGLVFLAPASPASAADFSNEPITSVTLTPKDNVKPGDTMRVDFTWEAPAGAAAGDTFSLDLPEIFRAVSGSTLDLTDEATGEVVATGVWDGNTMVFTFTDYVDTHDEVSGKGWVATRFDLDVVGDGEQTFEDVIIGGHNVGDVTKLPLVGNTTRAPSKGGQISAGSVWWFLQFPAATANDIAGPVTMTDTIDGDPGFVFDCTHARTKLLIEHGSTPSTDSTSYASPLTAPHVISYSCSPTSVTITLDKIPAGEFYTMQVFTTITDPGMDSFDNVASYTTPDGSSTTLTKSVPNALGGGDGTGSKYVSVGDYVWVDANRDGIQDADEEGIEGVELLLWKVADDGTVTPVLDSDGNQKTTTTDASGKYEFSRLPVLTAEEKYRVSVDNSQPALAKYSPTVSGSGDSAVDSSAAEGFADSVLPLTQHRAVDPTLDFGYYVTPEPTATPSPTPSPEPTPTATPTPTPTSGVLGTSLDDEDDDDSGVLPSTGGPALSLAVISALLIAVGGLTVFGRRREDERL